MQVFYLDNLNFGKLTTSKKIFPRVLEYPYDLLKTLEKEDRQHIGQTGLVEYGRHEVIILIVRTGVVFSIDFYYNEVLQFLFHKKQLMRDEEVIYSRNKVFRGKDTSGLEKVCARRRHISHECKYQYNFNGCPVWLTNYRGKDQVIVHALRQR